MRSILLKPLAVAFWTANAVFTYAEFGIVVTGIIAAVLVGRDLMRGHKRRSPTRRA